MGKCCSICEITTYIAYQILPRPIVMSTHLLLTREDFIDLYSATVHNSIVILTFTRAMKFQKKASLVLSNDIQP